MLEEGAVLFFEVGVVEPGFDAARVIDNVFFVDYVGVGDEVEVAGCGCG